MRKLNFSIPEESERIIGFTIPRNGSFHICDHDNVWNITIGLSPTVEVTDHDPYKFAEQNTDFLGVVFEGLKPNEPLMQAGESHIGCDFDRKNDFVTVSYEVDGRAGQIEFRTFSGDWFSASLSDDGRHLILAGPYEIALYEIS